MCKDMRRMDEKDKCNIILEDDCFYIQIIFSNVKDEIYLNENLCLIQHLFKDTCHRFLCSSHIDDTMKYIYYSNNKKIFINLLTNDI